MPSSAVIDGFDKAILGGVERARLDAAVEMEVVEAWGSFIAVEGVVVLGDCAEDCD